MLHASLEKEYTVYSTVHVVATRELHMVLSHDTVTNPLNVDAEFSPQAGHNGEEPHGASSCALPTTYTYIRTLDALYTHSIYFPFMPHVSSLPVTSVTRGFMYRRKLELEFDHTNQMDRTASQRPRP